MLEKIVIDWKYPFILEVEKGVVKRGYFGIKQREEIITDFSRRLKSMLKKYFEGKKVTFNGIRISYPSKPSKRILREVRRIPFGEVRTYGDIAKKLRTSPRAVGMALKSNKIPVIIPCHRVIGKKSLGGYSYGIEIKKKLLELENINLKF